MTELKDVKPVNMLLQTYSDNLCLSLAGSNNSKSPLCF